MNNVEKLGQVPRDSQLSIKIQQLVPHKTQGELHKPQVTPLRLPAEGTSGIVELPMEVANVDEMVVLNRKPRDEGLWSRRGRRDSAWKFAETPARAPTR